MSEYEKRVAALDGPLGPARIAHESRRLAAGLRDLAHSPTSPAPGRSRAAPRPGTRPSPRTSPAGPLTPTADHTIGHPSGPMIR
ncbi:hypothetical protein O1L60_31915 [Streptomyces diastatochromogenes]|nr:hypothetical protein [Streptomyces diastatochromogenes]